MWRVYISYRGTALGNSPIRRYTLKVAYKIWLDNNGKAFGEGPYQLMKRIEQKGSLHQAAMDMKMSYRKAWRTLNAIETKLGFLLLHRQVGGASGGGSQITDAGRELMKNYEGFRNDAREALQKVFEIHFGQGKEKPGKHKG